MFIYCFAWIGWAYDLKSIPWNVLQATVRRTGDGSLGLYRTHKQLEDEGCPPKQFSGLGDVDMTFEDYKSAEIYQPSQN